MTKRMTRPATQDELRSQVAGSPDRRTARSLPGLVGIPDRQRLLGQFQPLNFSGEPVPLGRIAQN
jgi:hypothetical protein